MLAFCSLGAIAQDFDYKLEYGKPFPRSKDNFVTLVSDSLDGYLGLRKPLYAMHYKNTLTKFNDELNPVSSKILKFRSEDKKLHIWKSLHVQGKFYVLYWKKSTLTSGIMIYQQEFDEKTLSPKYPAREVISVFNHSIGGNEYGVDLYVSEDGSKILLMGEKFTSSLEEIENNFIVFNSNFEKIFDRTVYINHVASMHQHEDVIITNIGEIYTIINVQETHKTTYSTKIFKVTKYNAVYNYHLSKEDVYPQDLHLHHEKNGNIFCVGVYKKDTNSFDIDGILFVELNHDKDEIIQDVVTEFTKEQFDKVNSKHLTELATEHTIIKGVARLNNQIVLMLEKFEETREVGESGGLYEVIYHHNDVVMCAMSEKGAINWTQTIMKKQPYALTGFDSPGSYKYHVYNDNIYLVSSLVSERPSGIRLHQVSADGDYSSSDILQFDGEPFFTRPACILADKNELLIPLQINEKKYRMLKVSLK